MSLVVLDIECFENKIVKELGVYKNVQIVGYSFLPPKKFKATTQSAWCTKHLHGTNWNCRHEKYTELEKILKKLKAPETEFFCNILRKKVKFWQGFLKQRLQTWMTTHAQKFRIWFSKMKNTIGYVAITHFVMQILFIVQKEKHLHTEHGLDVF